jgi:alkylation response protein AidB-like acyl-CoA dehydrogenase
MTDPRPVEVELIPHPSALEVSEERAHWRAVAAELADKLAADVLERDRANQPPFAEVDLFRQSGLLGLRIPAAHGGAGQDLATTFDVLRIIARVDGSIAHLLGYHYNFLVGSLSDAEPEVKGRVWQQTLAEQWFWASTGSPQDPDLVLEPADHGWTISGRKNFATGSRVADRLFGYVLDPDTGHRLVVTLDPSRPELVRRDDWNMLGQRLSASNGIEFHAYPVTRDDVLIDYGPQGGPPQPSRSLGVLFSQLLFSQLCQAVAEGVLLKARDYTRSSSRPWFHATVPAATEDPYIVQSYGLLASRLQAVAALNERATATLEWAHGRGQQLTLGQRAEVSEVIATSRVVANEVALEVANKIYDLTGARATDNRYGFDLAWRNIRTITLHDPQSYKAAEVGDYFLNGTLPTPSPYR